MRDTPLFALDSVLGLQVGIVPGAPSLFEESGKLEQVAELGCRPVCSMTIRIVAPRQLIFDNGV